MQILREVESFLQSSFGVTNTVVESIGDWMADEVRNHLSSIKALTKA
jgi:hypothetical protein